MAKHIGAYSAYHGPAGKVLTDYTELNIPQLWNRVSERIINVGNTGTIYTGLIPGYTASEPFEYTADKVFFFTPHIPCNSSPRISLNTLPSMPILFDGLPLGAGDLQPEETYTLVTRPAGGGFTFNLLPGLASPSHVITNNFTDLGAREDAEDDDLSRNDAALTQAMYSGQVWHTEPGARFRFSNGTTSPLSYVDDSGIVGRGSTKTILEMASGAGQFDSQDFHTQNASNKVLIYTTGKERQCFDGLHFRLEEPPAGTDRACYPLYFGNVGNLTIGDLEFSNFKHCDGGLLRLGSLRGITTLGTIIARDCNPDFPNNPDYTTAFSTRRQLTVVEIDNFKVNSAESTGTFRFSSIEGYNLLPSREVRDNWLLAGVPHRGAQTDVFNPQTRNNEFNIIGDRIIGISVGEVLDIQSDHFSIASITARHTYDIGAAKIVYGASNGSIGRIDCTHTALGVVYIQPANTNNSLRPANCQHIHIGAIRATNVGALYATEWEPRGNGMMPAIYVSSSNLLFNETTNIPNFIHCPDINITGSPDLAMRVGAASTGGPNVFFSGRISDYLPASEKTISNGPYVLTYRDTDLGSEEIVTKDFNSITYQPKITFTTQPTGMAYTAVWRGYRAFGWIHGTIQLVISSVGTGGAGAMHVSLPSSVSTSAFFSTAVDFSQVDLPVGTYGISALGYANQTYLLPRLYGDSLPALDLVPSMLCPGGVATTLVFNVSYKEDPPLGVGVVPLGASLLPEAPSDLLSALGV